MLLMKGGNMKKFVGVLGTMCLAMILAVMPLVLTGCGARDITADNFELTISVSSTTFNQGESIESIAILTNLSGRLLDVQISKYFLYEYVQGTTFIYEELSTSPSFISEKLEIYGSVQRVRNIGSMLEEGEYELRVRAMVQLSRRRFIEVESNMIELTVLKGGV